MGTSQNNNNCSIGCLNCIEQVDDKNNYVCAECYENYQFDSIMKKYVYSSCLGDSFFQVDEFQANQSLGNCFSICNPLYIGGPLQKVCKKLLECSSQFQTQQNFLGSDTPQQKLVYQNIYCVDLQIGYLSIYDKQSVQLIRHTIYSTNDLNAIGLDGNIVVIIINNQIFIWDVLTENRKLIYNSNKFFVDQQSKLYDLPNTSNIFEMKFDGYQQTFQKNLLIQQNGQIMVISQFSYSNNLLQLNGQIYCETSNYGPKYQSYRHHILTINSRNAQKGWNKQN
ncbi:hypothetical protein ABPG72_008766, partial [Tetrahymena utriculariae]